MTPSFPFSGPLTMTTARPTWTKVSSPMVDDAVEAGFENHWAVTSKLLAVPKLSPRCNA